MTATRAPAKALAKGTRTAEPSFASGDNLAELDGDWRLDLDGKQLTTSLRSWEELGTPSSTGTAPYRKQFPAATIAAKEHMYLEIADAHDYAQAALDGTELSAHAWQPSRWEITGALKLGPPDWRARYTAPPLQAVR